MAAKRLSDVEGFETVSLNPEAMKDTYDKFSKGLNSFADFQKGSMEAMMASANAFAKGVEQANSAQAGFAKEQYEEVVALTKAASATKSMQETIELQTEFVRASFERNMALFTKMTDHWNGVAKEVSEPLSKRYGEFVDMAQSYRA